MSSDESPNQVKTRSAPLTAEERRARHNEQSRIWHKEHPRKDRFTKEFRATRSKDSIRHMRESRKRGKTALVLAAEIEKVENYELAKQDNFDAKKWVIHHRLENEFVQETLFALGLYFFRTAKELIWLPAAEHKRDASIGRHRPDESKWHKKLYDRFGAAALERSLFLSIVKYLEDFGKSFDNAYKKYAAGEGKIDDVISWLATQLHLPAFFHTDTKRYNEFLGILSKSLPFILDAKGLLVSSSDSSSETNT